MGQASIIVSVPGLEVHFNRTDTGIEFKHLDILPLPELHDTADDHSVGKSGPPCTARLARSTTGELAFTLSPESERSEAGPSGKSAFFYPLRRYTDETEISFPATVKSVKFDHGRLVYLLSMDQEAAGGIFTLTKGYYGEIPFSADNPAYSWIDSEQTHRLRLGGELTQGEWEKSFITMQAEEVQVGGLPVTSAWLASEIAVRLETELTSWPERQRMYQANQVMSGALAAGTESTNDESEDFCLEDKPPGWTPPPKQRQQEERGDSSSRGRRKERRGR